MHKHYYIKYLRIAFIIILTVFSRNLFAQTDSIIIEHLSTKDGLSHKHIHCVMEDSYGFLWVGTDDGLNRYDGYEFVVYKSDFEDIAVTTFYNNYSFTKNNIGAQGKGRVTLVFLDTEEGWKIVHEHSSPFNQ